MKVTAKGQITIPSKMRKRQAAKLTRGGRVLAALLRGGKIKGRTEEWLRLTRGAA
jgi:hypothetical protein